MKFVIVFTVFILFSCEGERPNDIGVKDGLFKSCPDKSNSVSTQCENPEHKMNALSYHVTQKSALHVIHNILKAIEDVTIIKKDSSYIHAEFETGVGWVDDVEFYLNDTDKKIHFRSASRIGYSDFGTNKERMAEIRKKIRKKLDQVTDSSSSYKVQSNMFSLSKPILKNNTIKNYTINSIDTFKLILPQTEFKFNEKLLSTELYSMPIAKVKSDDQMPVFVPDTLIDHK